MTFDYPDLRFLQCAEGWIELDDPRSGLEELDGIRTDLQNTPPVLNLRFTAYSNLRDWQSALNAALALFEVNPDDVNAWINRSFALHELKRTREAQALLLPALEKFPKEPIVPYNLSCYACTLGDLDRARSFLDLACQRGDPKKIRQMAVEDPDLLALKLK